MISVLTSGVNSFTLQGDCLAGGGVEKSSISCHDDGWQVDLIFNDGRGRECRDGLHANAVPGVIREFMVAWHVERESIDVDEIRAYMQHVRMPNVIHSFYTPCTMSWMNRRIGLHKVDAELVRTGRVVLLKTPCGTLEGVNFRQTFGTTSEAVDFCESMKNRNINPGADGFSRIRPEGETHADRMARSRRS